MCVLLICATDCTCEESPVIKNPTCLQSICAPQDFNSLVAAEEARCPGVVTRADQEELTADVVTMYRRAPAATAWPREAEATALRQALAFDSSPKQIGFTMINSTTNIAHRGCGSSVTSAVASPLVLVSLGFAISACGCKSPLSRFIPAEALWQKEWSPFQGFRFVQFDLDVDD
ncbi:hypothetical protein VTO73DRAFT_9023 [Trametes versicolor]